MSELIELLNELEKSISKEEEKEPKKETIEETERKPKVEPKTESKGKAKEVKQEKTEITLPNMVVKGDKQTVEQIINGISESVEAVNGIDKAIQGVQVKEKVQAVQVKDKVKAVQVTRKEPKYLGIETRERLLSKVKEDPFFRHCVLQVLEIMDTSNSKAKKKKKHKFLTMWFNIAERYRAYADI